MDLSKIKCLSIAYPHISNSIMCSVSVLSPASLLNAGETQSKNTCIAIWDTGATGSAITELTAQKLNLAPIGQKIVSGLGGTITKNSYLVDILLPADVLIQNLPVTEIDNPIDANGNKVDNFGVLIGMDIIARGDFSITHVDGKTVMSFRMPSMVKVDYVEEWKRRNHVQNKLKRK